MIRQPERSVTIRPLLVPAVVFLALWQVLLSAQNPGLMSDDSGEMVAASYALGLPHPPGYPLYCLLGKVFSWLPVGTVAFRYNLLSSLIGLLALLLVWDTLRLLRRGSGEGPTKQFLDRFVPVLLVLSLFFNRSYFSQALCAKGLVYMLSFLFICVLTWFRVCRDQGTILDRPGRGLYPILFIFLVAFTNHWQTQVLLVPFMLVWHLQERNPWSLKDTFRSASFGLVALSLYLYLPLRSALNVRPDWGEPSHWTRFFWTVTRKLSSHSETPLRDWAHYQAWGGEYARLMTEGFWPGFWLIGCVGVVVLLVQKRRLGISLLTLYVTVLYALLTVARDEVLFLLKVYLLSIQGIFMVFAWFGAWALFRTLLEWRRWMTWMFAVFIGAALFQHVGVSFRAEDKSRYTLAQDLGTNALRDLPRNALFLSEGDHMLMPIWYSQFVEGKRPDLLFQPAPFLLHGWGWGQLADQDPRYRNATLPGQTFQQRLGLLAVGPRPLFYSMDRFYLGEELGKLSGTWSPSGLVLRGRREKVGALEVSREVLGSEAGWRLRGIGEYLSAPGRDLSSDEILHYYAQPHYLTSYLLYQEGRLWPAAKHLALGIEYQPRASAYGNIANLLGKMGKEGLALKYTELARRAREREGSVTPK